MELFIHAGIKVETMLVKDVSKRNPKETAEYIEHNNSLDSLWYSSCHFC